MSGVLILRPQPGAAETGARAARHGLDALVTPLFALRCRSWHAPDPADYDAIMLTSANAARLAGDAVASLRALRCYAVGERTAAEARNAGFADVRTGRRDAAALLVLMAEDGIRRALHLCGQDHSDASHPDVTVDRIAVYAADPLDDLPDPAAQALRNGAVALLHSPRAARIFTELVDRAGLERSAISIAAISPSAAEAAGGGWARSAVAAAPRDEALLEVAAKLCKTGPGATGPGDGL